LVSLGLGDTGPDPHASEVICDGLVEHSHLGAEFDQYGGPTIASQLTAIDLLQLVTRRGKPSRAA
jgi:hypothetical protein